MTFWKRPLTEDETRRHEGAWNNIAVFVKRHKPTYTPPEKDGDFPEIKVVQGFSSYNFRHLMKEWEEISALDAEGKIEWDEKKLALLGASLSLFHYHMLNRKTPATDKERFVKMLFTGLDTATRNEAPPVLINYYLATIAALHLPTIRGNNDPASMTFPGESAAFLSHLAKHYAAHENFGLATRAFLMITLTYSGTGENLTPYATWTKNNLNDVNSMITEAALATGCANDFVLLDSEPPYRWGRFMQDSAIIFADLDRLARHDQLLVDLYNPQKMAIFIGRIADGAKCIGPKRKKTGSAQMAAAQMAGKEAARAQA